MRRVAEVHLSGIFRQVVLQDMAHYLTNIIKKTGFAVLEHLYHLHLFPGNEALRGVDGSTFVVGQAVEVQMNIQRMLTSSMPYRQTRYEDNIHLFKVPLREYMLYDGFKHMGYESQVQPYEWQISLMMRFETSRRYSRTNDRV